MTYYIVLTIGPVQSYISQARRTQDLWQGSQILSYLAKVGVEMVDSKQQVNSAVDLIYPPVPEKGDKRSNIPNRILVQHNGLQEEAVALAGAIKERVEAAWKEIADNTYNYLSTRETTFDDIWKRQVENWLECYWVVDEAGNEDYPENIRQVNEAMSARKMLRNFPQVAEAGRKCSITGQHEALHTNRAGPNEFWTALREEQYNLSLLGQHERLSAIATVKRFAHESVFDDNGEIKPINPPLYIKERFPSTSSIAAVSFRYDVLKHWETLKSNVEKYLRALEAVFEAALKDDKEERDHERVLYFDKRRRWNMESFPYIERKLGKKLPTHEDAKRFRSLDGDYLFEDTLIGPTIAEYAGVTDENGKANLNEKSQALLQKAQQALRNLVSAAGKLNIAPPHPYLVILSMDGDSMGKTLGDIPSKDAHKQFSETIAEFARDEVPKIIERDHLGRVVYAGGDDVMALLPVRDALEVAEELRSAFRRTIQNKRVPCKSGGEHCYDGLDDAGQTGQFIKASASTGIVYVHHTHNLQQAIEAANDAQKNIAKKAMERNAIAVSLLRRSGEPRQMSQKWLTAQGEPVVSRIQALVAYFADGRLSRNLPQDIQAIIYSMTDPDDTVDVLAAARQAELERVLRRRLDSALVPDLKAAAAELADHITVLSQNKREDTEGKWQNALSWVELARFIAQSGLTQEKS